VAVNESMAIHYELKVKQTFKLNYFLTRKLLIIKEVWMYYGSGTAGAVGAEETLHVQCALTR